MSSLVFVVLIAVLAILALFAGSYDLRPATILQAMTGQAEGPARIVVLTIRLPRIVSALVSGFGLAVAGLAIQSLLRNPLGSAFTLGISQAAAFGAAFGIVCLGAGGMDAGALRSSDDVARIGSLFTVTVCAFAGALLSTSLILALAYCRDMTADAMILVGVALSSLFSAGTILLQYFADEVRLASIVFWTFGDVSRAGWREIAIMTGLTALGTLFYHLRREDLNAMLAGDDIARSVGVSAPRLRLIGMLLAGLLAGGITAYNGVIAFLGLLAPHIAARMVGANHRHLLVHSGLIGALLLLFADTLGRTVVGTGTLPVGVLTSFMGAPLFLYLLLKGKRRAT
jgi:iron complex transport system permease protein